DAQAQRKRASVYMRPCQYHQLAHRLSLLFEEWRGDDANAEAAQARRGQHRHRAYLYELWRMADDDAGRRLERRDQDQRHLFRIRQEDADDRHPTQWRGCDLWACA